MSSNQSAAGAAEFFRGLYGDAVGEDARLVVWSARDKQTVWAASIEEAAEATSSRSAVSDCYYGVCLQDRERVIEERRRRKGPAAAKPDGMNYARGYANTVNVVPALWLDLDVAGPGHEKSNLPKSEAEAWKIIDALPFAPSLVLATGGGFHVYWIFKEPWELESTDERNRAAGVMRGWQTLAVDAAANWGLVVDATHDLSRVLRPLGTMNHKYQSQVYAPAPFLIDGGPRYNPSDFEDWAVAVTPAVTLPEKLESVGRLQAEANPPIDKLMAMLNLQPRFAATWRRERKEFPSQSEYDLSLASMASNAGWEDGEVVNLIIAHRREGSQPLKLDRPDYYARLVHKAKSANAMKEAQERINDRVEAVTQGDTNAMDERDGTLRDLSALLGFPIRRIIKYISDPPQYRLVLEQGTIQLGEVSNILNSSKFRAAIAAVSGVLIQRFKGGEWDPVAQAILQAVEELDLGADSSAEALVSEWLVEYMTQHAPNLEKDEAIAIRAPFICKTDDGEREAFFLSEFRTWLGFHRDERLGRKQIATLLRASGCLPHVVRWNRGPESSSTTVNVWTLASAISSRLPKRAKIKQDNRDPNSTLNTK